MRANCQHLPRRSPFQGGRSRGDLAHLTPRFLPAALRMVRRPCRARSNRVSSTTAPDYSPERRLGGQGLPLVGRAGSAASSPRTDKRWARATGRAGLPIPPRYSPTLRPRRSTPPVAPGASARREPPRMGSRPRPESGSQRGERRRDSVLAVTAAIVRDREGIEATELIDGTTMARRVDEAGILQGADRRAQGAERTESLKGDQVGTRRLATGDPRPVTRL